MQKRQIKRCKFSMKNGEFYFIHDVVFSIFTKATKAAVVFLFESWLY